MNKESIILLEDIIDALEKVLKYTKNISFEEFCADEKTQDAVYRNFEVIGEKKYVNTESKTRGIGSKFLRFLL